MDRIEAMRHEALQASVNAEEAQRLLDALHTLRRVAGVSDGWAEPRPLSRVDAAFADVVIALTGETMPAAAVRAAAMDIVDAYTTE